VGGEWLASFQGEVLSDRREESFIASQGAKSPREAKILGRHGERDF